MTRQLSFCTPGIFKYIGNYGQSKFTVLQNLLGKSPYHAQHNVGFIHQLLKDDILHKAASALKPLAHVKF